LNKTIKDVNLAQIDSKKLKLEVSTMHEVEKIGEISQQIKNLKNQLMLNLKERDVSKRNTLISRKQLQTLKAKVDQIKSKMRLCKENLKNEVVKTYQDSCGKPKIKFSSNFS